VRLVAPLDNRIKHLQGLYRFDKKEALEFIKREDLDRKDFLLTYFHKDINDPLNYNLTINTGLMSDDEAAHLIAGAVIKKFPELFSVED
jgi:cytidylate kinase